MAETTGYGPWIGQEEIRVTFNVVLCAVSMAADSAAVLDFAAGLACMHGARLRIMHVFKPDEAETQARAMQDYFRDVVAADKRAGLTCEFVAGTGDVLDQVAQAAQESDVDLIVMGFRAGAALGPHRLDEVAARVGKPVLGVPAACRGAQNGAPGESGAEQPSAHFHSIVLATGLADQPTPALPLATRLAEASGARLTVVHAVPNLPDSLAVPEGFPASSYRDVALQDAAGRIDAAFGNVAGGARLTVCSGEASEEIARVAARERAELVIIGFHADNPHLTGSMLDRLLARLDCPVIAVPHTEAQRATAVAGGQ